MKKLTIIVTFLVTLLLVTPFVFASSGAPTMIEGASIRTSGEQGLRFYANLENEAVTSQGFYLVYGETSVVNLQTAISNAVEDNVMLNGKKVFKVEVENREPNGDFSVVLTGIPEVGYLDKITAIAYGVVDNAEIFVSAGTTRSIGEVAYKMAQAGQINETARQILDVIDNEFSALFERPWGTFEERSAIYSTDPEEIEQAFITDWNSKFGTTWTNIDATTFAANTRMGGTGSQNNSTTVATTRIYQFFNDSTMKYRWEWLLDYFIATDNITHAARQATAIKGDGTNGTHPLYWADHLSYSISNFFNYEHKVGWSTAMNFTLPNGTTRYRIIGEFNNRIVRQVDFTLLDKVGHIIQLPNNLTKIGKTFDGVYSDGVNSNLVTYTLGGNKILTPLFTNIDYEVKFFNGDNELFEFNETYTVESFMSLPSPIKNGYEFKGWFDNPSLNGTPITTINIGTTGNKIFYGKFDLPETFKVTFDLGVYGYHTMTKQELFEEFAIDYKAFFNLSGKTVNQLLTDWPVHATLPGGLTPMNLFNDSVYGLKWGWLKNYIQSESTRVNYQYNSNLFVTPNEAYWRYNLDSFWNNKYRTSWPVSMDYTNLVAANGFWTHTDYNEVITNFDENFVMFDHTNINIWNSDYEFIGWYDAEVGGNLVTNLEELSSNVTLYARYGLKV